MSAIAHTPVEQHVGIEPAMQALIDLEGPLPVVFIGLSFNLGLLVLAVELTSTRTVAPCKSVAIEVAALVLVGGLFNNLIGVVGAAVLVVGLGAIGLGVLKSVR